MALELQTAISIMEENKIRHWLAACAVVGLSSIAAINCGGDDQLTATDTNPPAPAPAETAPPIPLAEALGAIDFECEGQSSQQQQQQKKVSFQKEPSCTITNGSQQAISYQKSKVSDFDVKLNCSSKSMTVKNKGRDEAQQSFPIQGDGSVKGKISYQQQLQSDGKGNELCWVEYRVDFDGKAQCDTSPEQQSLDLTTQVSFQKSSEQQVQEAGIEDPDQPNPDSGDDDILNRPTSIPGVSPTPTSTATPSANDLPGTAGSPSPTPTLTDSGTPTPSPSPSVSPSPSPSPSRSPIPSGTPRPSVTVAPIPTITVRPIKVCVIENPCPVVAKTDMSCGSQQSQ